MFDPPRKADFLAAFAYQLTLKKGSKLEFTQRDLEEIYIVICGRFSLPPSEALSVAREIESHSGLIVKSSYDAYEFAHKSIQEYLVAEHISRLRDLPSTVSLLRSCPNELAIAVALSSDSTSWFCGLFRDKAGRVKPKPEWLLPFVARLVLECPGFEVSAELGSTVLWVFARCPDIIGAVRAQHFLQLPAIVQSVSAFLGCCEIKIGSSISILLKRRFEAKYSMPTRLDFPKEFAAQLSQVLSVGQDLA
jgi:hypothetical protein